MSYIYYPNPLEPYSSLVSGYSNLVCRDDITLWGWLQTFSIIILIIACQHILTGLTSCSDLVCRDDIILWGWFQRFSIIILIIACQHILECRGRQDWQVYNRELKIYITPYDLDATHIIRTYSSFGNSCISSASRHMASSISLCVWIWGVLVCVEHRATGWLNAHYICCVPCMYIMSSCNGDT